MRRAFYLREARLRDLLPNQREGLDDLQHQERRGAVQADEEGVGLRRAAAELLRRLRAGRLRSLSSVSRRLADRVRLPERLPEPARREIRARAPRSHGSAARSIVETKQPTPVRSAPDHLVQPPGPYDRNGHVSAVG
jgi:hypothetical protein